MNISIKYSMGYCKNVIIKFIFSMLTSDTEHSQRLKEHYTLKTSLLNGKMFFFFF